MKLITFITDDLYSPDPPQCNIPPPPLSVTTFPGWLWSSPDFLAFPLSAIGAGATYIGTTLLRPPLRVTRHRVGEKYCPTWTYFYPKNVFSIMFRSYFMTGLSLKIYFKQPSWFMRFFSHPKLLAFWLRLYDMPPPSHSHSGYLPTSTKWRNTRKLMELVQVLKHRMETQTDFFRDVLTEKDRDGQRRKGKPRSWKRLGKKSWRLWDTLFPVCDLMREKLTQWMWLKGLLVTFKSFMRKSHREWLSIKKRWLNLES